MQRFTVAVLVKNRSGVLNRVTGMFRRRQFNINSLTVSETESPECSRITVLFDGEENTKQQLINQLYKLPDVCGIREFSSDSSVSRELMLIKLKNEQGLFEEIRAAAEVFDVKTIDYSRENVILQLTGETRRLDDFLQLMRDYEIIEICRTGIVSLEKGDALIRKVTNL